MVSVRDNREAIVNVGCEMPDFVFFEFIINIIRDTRKLLVIKAVFDGCETFSNGFKIAGALLWNVSSI